MKIDATKIDGIKILTPRKFSDERGFFSETYNAQTYAEAGIFCTFVQDNHAYSAAAGVLRGLHFQTPPCAQDKLVRVARGVILDVAVDLRAGSPTYGQHVAVELSEENFRQFFIPAGFAHGYCTLTPDTHVLYKASHAYAPSQEQGLAFDDPALYIAWPFEPARLIVSDKDRQNKRLADLGTPFP